jgi:hypothetical protein
MEAVVLGVIAGASVGLMIFAGVAINELEKQTCLEAGYGTFACGVHEEDYEG